MMSPLPGEPFVVPQTPVWLTSSQHIFIRASLFSFIFGVNLMDIIVQMLFHGPRMWLWSVASALAMILAGRSYWRDWRLTNRFREGFKGND